MQVSDGFKMFQVLWKVTWRYSAGNCKNLPANIHWLVPGLVQKRYSNVFTFWNCHFHVSSLIAQALLIIFLEWYYPIISHSVPVDVFPLSSHENNNVFPIISPKYYIDYIYRFYPSKYPPYPRFFIRSPISPWWDYLGSIRYSNMANENPPFVDDFSMKTCIHL